MFIYVYNIRLHEFLNSLGFIYSSQNVNDIIFLVQNAKRYVNRIMALHHEKIIQPYSNSWYITSL